MMRMMELDCAVGSALTWLVYGLTVAFDPTFASASDADTGPQVTEGVVAAPAAEVWKVFSTAEGFKKLGVAQCEMDFRLEGLIRTHYGSGGVLGDDGTIQNEILSYEPGRMVSFRIQKPPRGFPFTEATWKGTWTVVTLEKLGSNRTHVRIAGMGYGDSEEGRKMRQFFESGNAHTLRLLQSQFDSSASTPRGPAHTADPLAPVRVERVIELPRDDAWKLLATREGWTRTMGVTATIELRPGGRFEVLFDPRAPGGEAGSEGCTVLSFLPGRMLSFTWNANPKFAHARERKTWVVVQFEELAASRTLIRLEHLGFAEQAAENPDHREEWEQVRAYFQQAWGKVLDAAKACESKP